ncbi:MAG: hypothetical protein J0M12_17015, partial [Deltaproteobacteria bacterium]|nr:hypothetical protein [Deltaproteobacteria bacterium]
VNIERLSKAIHALSVSEDSATGAGPRQHHLKALHASEAVLLERVRAAEGEFEEARRERSAKMAAADATLKTAGPSSEYRARVHAFRKPFDEAVQQRLLALRSAWSEILEFYDEEWPGGVTRYAIKLESIADRQVATYIFSIGADGKPVFAPEHVGFKRTHSESLQGKNMYAGGEISFSTHDVSFRSLEAWIKFDQQLSTLKTPLPLTLAALTDGSGHYEPLPATLQYANNIICPRFAALGIETAHVKHRDGLAPFVRMRGLTYDFGRTAQDGRGPSAQ